MNKTRVIVGAVVVAAAIAVLVLMKSTDRGSNAASSSAPRSDVPPKPAGPAMATQSVLRTREEGVVPLPSDAMGISPPPNGANRKSD